MVLPIRWGPGRPSACSLARDLRGGCLGAEQDSEREAEREGRARDLARHLDALRTALAGHDAQAMADAARRAQIALEFRMADPVLGIEPLDSSRLAALRVLIEEAMERAAELGDPDAQVRVAERIYWRQDQARAALARQHATAAASRPRARTLLGWFDYTGFGGPVDLPASLAHHRSAAEAGEADSLFELYVYASKGIAMAPDEAQARRWCQAAAEAGNARAMANLGALYATGGGVPLDMAEAIRWYTRAAELGHGRAAATLCVMYARGTGLPVDLDSARRWLHIALELGQDAEQLAQLSGYDEVVIKLLEEDP